MKFLILGHGFEKGPTHLNILKYLVVHTAFIMLASDVILVRLAPKPKRKRVCHYRCSRAKELFGLYNLKFKLGKDLTKPTHLVGMSSWNPSFWNNSSRLGRGAEAPTGCGGGFGGFVFAEDLTQSFTSTVSPAWHILSNHSPGMASLKIGDLSPGKVIELARMDLPRKRSHEPS